MVGEIETLQRCATLHSWNAQFWFSLALAYEKASVSCSNLCQDEDVTKVERERISFKKHNPAIENCTKRHLNGESQSQEGCCMCTTKCPCLSTKKQIQSLTQTEPCCLDEEKIRNHLANVDTGEQDSSVTQSDKKTELQDQSISCLCKGCSDSLADGSDLYLFSSNKKYLLEECECTRKRLKWRNHALSFGSLVKTR